MEVQACPSLEELRRRESITDDERRRMVLRHFLICSMCTVRLGEEVDEGKKRYITT
jgi:hypothetical protein